MNSTIFMALEIMWKGMAGIFAAVLVIMAIVYLMGKWGKAPQEDLENCGKKESERQESGRP